MATPRASRCFLESLLEDTDGPDFGYVARLAREASFWERPVEFEREEFVELDDGIVCVDLTRIEMKDLEERMDTLLRAPGIVFDLRGYPNRNHGILAHLLTEPDTSTEWMQIPKIIYPDGERWKWRSASSGP